jgi:anti-sigma B factor antagonist
MKPLSLDSKLIKSARLVEVGDDGLAGDRPAVVVELCDEIDLHNSPQLREAIIGAIEEHEPSKLVLCLADVPYMDSSAIAVLVEALQRLRKAGGKVYLTDLHDRVKGLLEIARLDTIFEVEPDAAAALAAE